MSNLFYSLPCDIIRHIYEFDPTFKKTIMMEVIRTIPRVSNSIRRFERELTRMYLPSSWTIQRIDRRRLIARNYHKTFHVYIPFEYPFIQPVVTNSENKRMCLEWWPIGCICSVLLSFD